MTEKNNDLNKPTQRKKIRFERKQIIVGSGILVLALAGIFTGVFLINIIQPIEKKTFSYGVGYNPFAPDPVLAGFAYDGVSVHIINQITEGLFTTEFVGSSSRIAFNLAESADWSDDNLNFTCSLRHNVWFHDGSPFNAYAVKWNIDRLHRLYDAYGLGDYLFQFPDGEWIINNTIVLDDYTIRFVLERPFSPLPALLSSQFANILRPNATLENDFIDPISKKLCGTGPFKFDSFEENNSVTLLPNSKYWNGPNYVLDRIIFRIFYPNDTLGIEALKNEDISMIYNSYYNEHIESLKDVPGITVRKFTTPFSNVLDMNNKYINSTMRKAISYAFNYSHFINEVRNNGEERMRSPIPEIIRYSNYEDLDVPYCNISLARQTLIDANWNGTMGLLANNDISSDNPWKLKANSTFPLATYNYSYIWNWDALVMLYEPLADYLSQIGVKVNANPCSYAEFYGRIRGIWGYERTFNLYITGWNPDYNEPSSVITPLYSNSSIDNSANVNDTQLQAMIEQSIEETNESKREQIFFNIQERIIEELYPSLWLYFDVKYDAYVSNLRNVPIPHYIKFSFKDIYFA